MTGGDDGYGGDGDGDEGHDLKQSAHMSRIVKSD